MLHLSLNQTHSHHIKSGFKYEYNIRILAISIKIKEIMMILFINAILKKKIEDMFTI